MFGGWDNFYLLVGSAAAALIGLLFVVATLTTSLESAVNGASLYMSPTVFHFAVVLVLSGVALAPGLAPPVVGAMVGVAALVGLIYATKVGWAIFRGRTPNPAHWTDFWCYGVMPGAIYLGLCALTAALVGARPYAALVLGVLLMALLLVGVRNAWDLVTYLAPRKNQGGPAVTSSAAVEAPLEEPQEV